jgi:hypothetical protein
MSGNKPGLICNLLMGIKLRLDGISPYQKLTDLFRELV